MTKTTTNTTWNLKTIGYEQMRRWHFVNIVLPRWESVLKELKDE